MTFQCTKTTTGVRVVNHELSHFAIHLILDQSSNPSNFN